MNDDLNAALDALEGMVEQYLHEGPEGEFDHSCMSAGEEATEVLLRYRPHRWTAGSRGLKRRPGEESVWASPGSS